MATRFRKSKKVGATRFTLGKKSFGTSVGGKWAGISMNSKSGLHVRTSIPGTGISHTYKIGGKKRKSPSRSGGSSRQSRNTQNASVSPVIQQPVPRRTWFIIVAICLLVGGLGNIGKSWGGALIGLIGGGIMLYLTFKTPGLPKIDYEQFSRQLQIFDESVKLFMSTESPETYFGRYSDAERSAAAMAEMTDAPLVHDETPQDAVEMLVQQKTEATNAFLDRYAKATRMKAYELTRGRKQKLESFKLITTEYESQMTQESIKYRDQLYTDMISSIEE